MARITNFIREIRNSNSVFARISVSLLFLLIVMALFITFWINHIATSNQQRLVMETNMDRIRMMDQTLEQVLDDTAQTMTEILWGKDFCDYMVTTSSTDQSSIYRMIRQLQSQVQGSPVVKESVFYSPVNETVMRNERYAILGKEEWEDSYILDQVTEGENCILFRADSNDVYTYLLYDNGRIFLCQYFHPAQNIGILTCEMDVEALNSLISNGSGTVDDTVFIYDADGDPVMTGDLPYGEIEIDWDHPENFLTSDELSQSDGNYNGDYYYVSSERLGWQYLMRIDAASMRASYRDSVSLLLPALLILLLFSILITLYVVYNIYQPINRLVNIAAGAPVKTRKEKRQYNEFDLLEGAYSDARDRQEHMTSVIHSVAPDVLENMLLKILNGRSVTMEQAEATLEEIEKPMPAVGRFLICVCVIEEPKNRSVTEPEWNLYRTSLRSLMEQWLSETSSPSYGRICLDLDSVTFVAVLSFSEETSAVVIKQESRALWQALEGNVKQLPYRLWMESGPICSQIIDIRESYLRARKKIQYDQYAESDSRKQTAEEGEKEKQKQIELDRFWFQECSQEFVNQMAKGKQEEVGRTLERVFSEVHRQYEGNQEGCRECMEMFMDEVLERLITYPLTSEEQEKLEEQSILSTIRDSQDEESLFRYVENCCQEICQLIGAYSRKNQFRYIETAKEFIADNYTNSNLALNDVAEYIGISASYLSELFNEIAKEKFSTYLASYRAQKAEQLLKVTRMTIKEIGFECGFNSVQNFIRVFKKQTGFTPGQYRDANQ